MTDTKRIYLVQRGVRGAPGATVTAAAGSAVSLRSAMAAIASPAAGQFATLTEAGREGTFVFDDSDLSAEVAADTQQGIYIAPSSDTSGASGAWVRKAQTVTPFMFGVVGDGETDDSDAFAAFNTWATSAIRRCYCDFTAVVGTTQKLFVGPETATPHNGPRYNFGGDLRVVALAALDEICEVRNLTTSECPSVFADGTGDGADDNKGVDYSTRTCGIGIKVTNCSVGIIDKLFARSCQLWGVFFPSDGTHFNDNLTVKRLRGYSCGSGGNVGASSALSANWSSPVSSAGWSGNYGQHTDISVDALPPALIDDYAAQIAVELDGRPYIVTKIDRGGGTIRLYPALHPDTLAAAAGTLNYIFGGVYEVQGGDSGIISIGELHAVNCGIAIGENSLYGSNVANATTEFCGIRIATGSRTDADGANAHIGGVLGSVYGEGNRFEVVNFGEIGELGFQTILNTYGIEIEKCWNLFGPMVDTGEQLSSTLGLSTVASGTDYAYARGGFTLGYQGTFLSAHQNSLTAPPGQFADHLYNANPKLFAGDVAVVAIKVSGKRGAFRRLFGLVGNRWTIFGTGANNAPTLIHFDPPTDEFAGCGTTTGDATVTVPDTRGMFAGQPITGAGIPANTTIASVTDRTHIELSANATATGTAKLTVTGSINGAFEAVELNSFSGPADLAIFFTDPYELQWKVAPVSGATGASGSAAIADRGDETVTLNAGTDARTQRWNEPLTDNRIADLSVDASDGAEFRVLRTAAATGVSTLSVTSNGNTLRTLAAGEWGHFIFSADLTAWVEVASGSL